jgi:lipid-binding SYLF domain-containing protein/predicted outer membrane protein
MTRIPLIWPAVLALGLASASAQPSPAAPAQPQARPLAAMGLTSADLEFMLAATRAGHLETTAARLALSRSDDPGVRQLAQRLLDDHQAAQAQLQRIAQNRGVELPRRPARQQQYVIDGLQGLRGASFESDFVERIGIDAHRDAIALFQRQLGGANRDAALKDFARATLPKLRQHLAMAQALQAHEGSGATRETVADAPDPAGQARAQIREAVQVVERMKADPQVARLLERAQGVFILPDYGRVALGLGAQAGQGVLVTRRGEDFSDPVFYTMGGISIGAQAGAAAGEIALLLMTERAVQRFRSDRGFSVVADAGLTIGNYSTRDHASAGKVQDIVVWSGTSGAYAGLSLGLTDVAVDAAANRAYYGRPEVSPLEILAGRVENPQQNVLGIVLGV